MDPSSGRAHDNDPRGDLAFWSQIIEERLRESGGYALLARSDVKCRSGLPGVQLRFGHDEGKRSHLYLLAIFVDDKRMFLVEAGGVKADVERRQPQIDRAIRDFLPE